MAEGYLRLFAQPWVKKNQPLPVNFLLSLQRYFKVNPRVGYWLICTMYAIQQLSLSSEGSNMLLRFTTGQGSINEIATLTVVIPARHPRSEACE